MIDTNTLIKHVAFDIISVITCWGVCNNSNINIRINSKIYSIPTNLIGLGISTYFLTKYIWK